MNPSEWSGTVLAWITAATLVSGAMSGCILSLMKHARDIQAAWDAVRVLQRQVGNMTGIISPIGPTPPIIYPPESRK